jgi:hypothetical protein
MLVCNKIYPKVFLYGECDYYLMEKKVSKCEGLSVYTKGIHDLGFFSSYPPHIPLSTSRSEIM